MKILDLLRFWRRIGMRTFLPNRFWQDWKNGWKQSRKNLNPILKMLGSGSTDWHVLQNPSASVWITSNNAQQAGMAVPEDSNHFYESHFLHSRDIWSRIYCRQETQFKWLGSRIAVVIGKRAKYVFSGKCHGLRALAIACTMTSAKRELFNSPRRSNGWKEKVPIVLLALGHSLATREESKTA